jgi:hypothetical protein
VCWVGFEPPKQGGSQQAKARRKYGGLCNTQKFAVILNEKTYDIIPIFLLKIIK